MQDIHIRSPFLRGSKVISDWKENENPLSLLYPLMATLLFQTWPKSLTLSLSFFKSTASLSPIGCTITTHPKSDTSQQPHCHHPGPSHHLLSQLWQQLPNWDPQFCPGLPSVSAAQSDTVKPLSRILTLLCSNVGSQLGTKVLPKACKAVFCLICPLLIKLTSSTTRCRYGLPRGSSTHQIHSLLKIFELAHSCRNALPADTHTASSLNCLLASPLAIFLIQPSLAFTPKISSPHPHTLTP